MAMALSVIAARVAAIRDIDESFIMNTLGESGRNKRWTLVLNSETSSKCCNIDKYK